MESTSPSPATGLSRFSKINPWLLTLISSFVLLVCFGFRLINDTDLGFHLKGGQWILENYRIPFKDTYTFSVLGHEYLDIQWLYQVILFLLFKVGGYSSLTLFTTALIFLVFTITFKRLRLTGVPLPICVFLLTVVLLGSEIRFRVRPEILSWVLMSLVFWVLEFRAKRKRDYLFLLPIIQVVWVNIEGLFAIGLGISFFYFLADYFQEGKVDKKLLKYLVLSMTACLVNPYFIKGAIYPLSYLIFLSTSSALKSGINEFQSPWTMGSHYAFPPEWTLWTYKFFSIFLLLLIIATFKKRKLLDFLIFVSFFYISATAQRNIALFMLACSPLAATCWKDLEWSRLRKFQGSILFKPLTAWIFMVFILGLSLRVITNSYYVSERRFERFGLGLDENQIPIRATEFLVNNHLDGKIFNQLNFGGWLDWKGPQKIFIDGRLEVMGNDFFSEYKASEQAGGLALLTSKYNIDILFFSPDHASQWLYELKNNPGWRPVYLDETGVIFLRKGYAPQVPLLDDEKILEEKGISADAKEKAFTILQNLNPSVFKYFLEDFYQPTRYSAGLETLANYYFYSGRFDDAEKYFSENIIRTKGRYYDLIFNLGGLYVAAQKYSEARFCMERVLQEKPDLKPALNIMAHLR